MKLVLQSFGNEREYKRAIFAIYSFYANLDGCAIKPETVLFTDNPSYFAEYFNDFSVRYILLTRDTIQRMRGDIDFIHRIKIACIEQTLELDDIFYVDSDTFFISNPTRIIESFSPAITYMHVREYSFDTLRDQPLPAGRTFRAFFELITSCTFAVEKRTITVGADKYSWNAGVIVLHQHHKVLLDQVYALTDQFYSGTKNHASEQYAFSIVLQDNAMIQPCDDVVYHYWYVVKKRVADKFFEHTIGLEWARRDLSERLNDVKRATHKLTQMFESNYEILQDNAIQAFHRNEFGKGLQWVGRAALKKPFDFKFWRNVLFHIKRKFVAAK